MEDRKIDGEEDGKPNVEDAGTLEGGCPGGYPEVWVERPPRGAYQCTPESLYSRNLQIQISGRPHVRSISVDDRTTADDGDEKPVEEVAGTLEGGCPGGYPEIWVQRPL